MCPLREELLAARRASRYKTGEKGQRSLKRFCEDTRARPIYRLSDMSLSQKVWYVPTQEIISSSLRPEMK